MREKTSSYGRPQAVKKQQESLPLPFCRAENIDPSHERDISAFLKVLADEYRREDLEKGSRIQ